MKTPLLSKKQRAEINSQKSTISQLRNEISQKDIHLSRQTSKYEILSARSENFQRTEASSKAQHDTLANHCKSLQNHINALELSLKEANNTIAQKDAELAKRVNLDATGSPKKDVDVTALEIESLLPTMKQLVASYSDREKKDVGVRKSMRDFFKFLLLNFSSIEFKKISAQKQFKIIFTTRQRYITRTRNRQTSSNVTKEL